MELSSYPARCVVGLERRTLPGETAASVAAELDALLEACRAVDPDLVAEHRTLLVREPFEVPADAEIAAVVGAAAEAVTGTRRPVGGASYWADAAFIAAAGIPTVMFGPSGEGAHAIEEWVSVADTEAVVGTLVAAARADLRVSVFANPAVRPEAVPPPSGEAASFHAALPGYRPTPLRDLPGLAAELGLGAVALKDESDRLGLPAFKVLGASWAAERALRERPDARTLVAASAGNHGRAVAHVAALRGLACRIFLPARSAAARRAAIAGEGAELVVVDGTYEDAVALAAAAGREPGAIEIADVGTSGPAHWVIDGYQTLFAEAAAQGRFDVIVVPVGVGSLAAAAARFGAHAGRARDRCRAGHRGLPDRLAPRGRAGRRAEPRHDHGRPGLRGGLPGGLARAARRHPRNRDGLRRRRPRRRARARGERARDRGVRRRPAGGAASAAAADAAALEPSSRVLLIATEGPTDPETYRAALA